MPEIKRSALVPHRAMEMYVLVLDVASYPQFLPWCRDASVLEKTDSHQLATVRIAGNIPQTAFTTRNDLIEGQQINMALVDGPFRRLQGQWFFTELSDEASKVELNIDFEFSTTSFAALIKPVFTVAASTMVDAFVAEARRRYG